MLSKEKMMRIEVLAQKQKDGILSADEAAEQTALRQEYALTIRSRIESNLKDAGAKKLTKKCSCGCQHK